MIPQVIYTIGGVIWIIIASIAIVLGGLIVTSDMISGRKEEFLKHSAYTVMVALFPITIGVALILGFTIYVIQMVARLLDN